MTSDNTNRNPKHWSPPRTTATTSRLELEDGIVRKIMHQTAAPQAISHPRVFSRIEENIAAGTEETRQCVTTAPLADLWSRLRSWLASPRLAWGVAGLQAAAIVLFLVFSVPVQTSLHTLSSTGPAMETGSFLYILFDDAARMKDIETLLSEADLRIVSGPSKRGIYTLRVPANTDPETLVRMLKEKKSVAFVEQAF